MPSEYSSLFLGLVLSLLFAEVTGYTPGGLIVPGYFAIYLSQPLRPMATILIAFLALAIYRFFSLYFILFGRRRFVFLILLGVVLSQLWALALPHLFSEPIGLRVIGWVVPGLLASNLERQKIWPTLASLILVSVLTFFLVRLFI